MILAAARFGERKKGASSPDILSLAFQCEQWGVAAVMPVPVPRWLLDQMTSSLSVFRAFRAHADKNPKLNDIQWSAYHPGYWKTIMSVERLKFPKFFSNANERNANERKVH